MVGVITLVPKALRLVSTVVPLCTMTLLASFQENAAGRGLACAAAPELQVDKPTAASALALPTSRWRRFSAADCRAEVF
ncbi:hypothetical protein D3C80_1649480 [compost metagenome]